MLEHKHDYVKVCHQLLHLSVATFVHFKDLMNASFDFDVLEILCPQQLRDLFSCLWARHRIDIGHLGE
jgi:hypothetical protein